MGCVERLHPIATTSPLIICILFSPLFYSIKPSTHILRALYLPLPCTSSTVSTLSFCNLPCVCLGSSTQRSKVNLFCHSSFLFRFVSALPTRFSRDYCINEMHFAL